jgi:hypothetical protein
MTTPPQPPQFMYTVTMTSGRTYTVVDNIEAWTQLPNLLRTMGGGAYLNFLQVESMVLIDGTVDAIS